MPQSQQPVPASGVEVLLLPLLLWREVWFGSSCCGMLLDVLQVFEANLN
jgi:hypothetical protein